MGESESTILELKRSAAQDFTRMFLSSAIGEQVIKVILLGSVARGEAKEDSDVDLLEKLVNWGRVHISQR
jgi:predicted nucleotidyltransferase